MLSRTLLHIYGPFCIYSYGLMIAIGAILTFYLIKHNPKRASIISNELLLNVFSLSILSGVIGGRILHTIGSYDRLSSWFDVCALHEGGLSILGCVLAILLVIPWYLQRNKVQVLPFLDLLALYAPLLQAISRIGCYFAGCCFGTTTTLPWAIIYTTTDTLAPRFCALHPTQLYASMGLFAIFCLQYVTLQYRFKKPGQLTCIYLFLAASMRFVVDFWRADREYLSSLYAQTFSMHQWIALGIMLGAVIAFRIFSRNTKNI